MSETVVTIHYQSPAEDPFKVPRPTRIWEDAAGNVKTTGGEGEISGDQLIGLSPSVDPAPGGHDRVLGPPESFDPWVGAEELISEGVADLELAGWFPVFMSSCGEWIYTWSVGVDRVEILGTDEVAEFRAES